MNLTACTCMPELYNKLKWAPAGAKYIGRGSPWGNPYIIGEHGTREQCIKLFAEEILPDLDLEELVGCDLVCFCWPKPCHGQVILDEIERRKQHVLS